MSTFDPEIAVRQFEKRKAENAEKPKIDNASLPAGSPMYYYCKFCGDHTETLPETHIRAPKVICDPCKVLNDHGLIPRAG